MCLSLFENCVMQFFTDTIAEYLSHSTKKAIEAKRRRRSGKAWKKKTFLHLQSTLFTVSFQTIFCRLHSFLSVFVNSVRIVLQGLQSCKLFITTHSICKLPKYVLSFLSYEFSRPKWLKMIHENFLGCFSTTNKEAILKIICTKMNWWSNHIFLG